MGKLGKRELHAVAAAAESLLFQSRAKKVVAEPADAGCEVGAGVEADEEGGDGLESVSPWVVTNNDISAGIFRVRSGSRLFATTFTPPRPPPPPPSSSSAFASSTSSRRATRGGLVALGVAGLIGGTVGGFYLADPAHFSHNRLALVRSYRAGMTGIKMGLDYKWSLRNGPDVIGQDAYEAVKRACHQRCAERLLQLCKDNQGIYIKLGQHIAAMVFLLPVEYTETMRPLQDKCPETSEADIEALFRSDLGCRVKDMFSWFDPKPLGVASLAQVHRATLVTGQEVAVKVQHPVLDAYAPVDIATTASIVRLAKRMFKDFDFEWLAEELRDSLPQELDFENEARNADKIRGLFRGNAMLKIPDVYWAARRVLIMEYVNGGKIDDLNYMRAHNVDPKAVSQELSEIYSEMIFVTGFVHCDPHPGNVFVRPRARPLLSYIPFLSAFLSNPHNFQIVLLDHGLYRQLKPSFRLDYAHLWSAILAGDEAGILDYSYRLFTAGGRRAADGVEETDAVTTTRDGIDYHRLFASMLTGRSWDVISDRSGGLAQVRTEAEMGVIKKKAATGRFFVAIADILAKLPRELLLLLKTNDLLRAVDESLAVSGTAGGSSALHMMATVATMGWYCAKAIKDETVNELKQRAAWWRPVWTSGQYWRCKVEFWRAGVRVWAVRAWVGFSLLKQQLGVAPAQPDLKALITAK
ncbi:putative aarF domain-containing protein kinase 1 [Geranomyces michiganensis]|nr:putative aarF domain-containing protein kinase 1 [Geranomyces michiganensis]